jgi:hypothetical protein
MERGREPFRQDGEITLYKAVGDAGGARRHAGAAGVPGHDARGQGGRAIRVPFRSRQAGHDEPPIFLDRMKDTSLS